MNFMLALNILIRFELIDEIDLMFFCLIRLQIVWM